MNIFIPQPIILTSFNYSMPISKHFDMFDFNPEKVENRLREMMASLEYIV